MRCRIPSSYLIANCNGIGYRFGFGLRADTDCDLLLEINVKKLIFVAAGVALLIMGIGAGAVLSAEKRVAHYGPNFVCLLNAAGAIECLGSDIFGVVSSVPDVNGFTEINGGDTYACAYNETESFDYCWGGVARQPATMPESTMTPEPSVTETPSPMTYRSLVITDEDRCSDYDADDYSYPQSVEDDIVAGMGGIIYSPYTGEYFDSTGETDIEHIVARSEARDSGLCDVDAETRDTFASDLLNLTLADPNLNRNEKVAKDAAEWLPEINKCWFAYRVVQVRAKYSLTVDQAEADALEAVLSECSSFEMVVVDPETEQPTPVPTVEPETTPTPEGTPEATPVATATPEIDALALYDDNGDGQISCAEARAHGIAPVHSDHPAYPYMNDADGDGVVCE